MRLTWYALHTSSGPGENSRQLLHLCMHLPTDSATSFAMGHNPHKAAKSLILTPATTQLSAGLPRHVIRLTTRPATQSSVRFLPRATPYDSPTQSDHISHSRGSAPSRSGPGTSKNLILSLCVPLQGHRHTCPTIVPSPMTYDRVSPITHTRPVSLGHGP